MTSASQTTLPGAAANRDRPAVWPPGSLVTDEPRGPGAEPADADDESDDDGKHETIVVTAPLV
jgi:hypothetical protein